MAENRCLQNPIDRAKVEALKTSIKDTGFWDNILVRKKNGKYQIAYGHPRLLAIRELGIEKIEAPVRDLEDAAMLRIMAEENIEWSTSPAVINETVLAVKMFLDGELAKYETWEEFRSNKSIRPIIKAEPEFRNIKSKGVGKTLIKISESYSIAIMLLNKRCVKMRALAVIQF